MPSYVEIVPEAENVEAAALILDAKLSRIAMVIASSAVVDDNIAAAADADAVAEAAVVNAGADRCVVAIGAVATVSMSIGTVSRAVDTSSVAAKSRGVSTSLSDRKSSKDSS
jgi:hypothetical protein